MNLVPFTSWHEHTYGTHIRSSVVFLLNKGVSIETPEAAKALSSASQEMQHRYYCCCAQQQQKVCVCHPVLRNKGRPQCRMPTVLVPQRAIFSIFQRCRYDVGHSY